VTAEGLRAGGAVAAPPAWYVTSVELLRLARSYWRHVLTLAVTGAVVGAITALVLPSRYRAKAAFQAENPPNETSLSGGGLAGLLGSQLASLPLGATQNRPQLLADLLVTDAVLRHVVNATFLWEGRPQTLVTIYGYASKPRPELRDYLAIKKLHRAVSVDVDIRTGIVRFDVEAYTPELALAVAETTLAALNEANVALRQRRGSAERAFTAQRSADARLLLAAAESTLALFNQTNRNLQTSATLQLEQARLRRNVDMAQQLFLQLQLQEEQAALQELRNTPTISVIDPPVLPARHSWPNRPLAVITGLLIGLLVAYVRLSVRPAALGRGAALPA
jgi:uncharacterized protein involved in exopolysaccharide biosynthesis